MKLKEYGSELIEVADDGTGVSKVDFDGLGLKHHTSKFSNITDFQVYVRCASQMMDAVLPAIVKETAPSALLACRRWPALASGERL